MFHDIAREFGDEVVAITLQDIVCPSEICPLIVRDVVMRYDGSHFTATASRELAPWLERRLNEAGIDLSRLMS